MQENNNENRIEMPTVNMASGPHPVPTPMPNNPEPAPAPTMGPVPMPGMPNNEITPEPTVAPAAPMGPTPSEIPVIAPMPKPEPTVVPQMENAPMPEMPNNQMTPEPTMAPDAPVAQVVPTPMETPAMTPMPNPAPAVAPTMGPVPMPGMPNDQMMNNTSPMAQAQVNPNEPINYNPSVPPVVPASDMVAPVAPTTNPADELPIKEASKTAKLVGTIIFTTIALVLIVWIGYMYFFVK